MGKDSPELQVPYVASSQSVVATTGFLALGPYSIGTLVRFIEVVWSVKAATIVGFGAGLTSDPVASLVAFNASRSLFQGKGSTIGQQASMALDLGGAADGRFRVPVNRVLTASLRSFVFAWVSTEATVVTFFTPSVWLGR